LDDYEEGTWTPILSDGTNKATATAPNGGTYTKVGNIVTLYCYIVISSLGSVSGNVRITGLPFTMKNSAAAGSVVPFANSLSITAGQSVGAYIQANTNFITLQLWSATGGTTNMQASNWTATGQLRFSITYNV
jgi:hypothetical protein